MRILPSWLRTMVAGALPDDEILAEQLTLIGIAVEGIDRGGPETVFEMEITTNRVDAMNHYGIARECSALYDVDLVPITPELSGGGSEGFDIRIMEPALCARYTAMVLRGVAVKASGGEVAERFAALGLKAINQAADATNYVLYEMGHPTHVFDLDKLAGGKIVVRLARAGERLKTLDGVERRLAEDDLVIADAEKAVALAGVIGGDESKVTEATRNLLIESAWFDTATVRRSSRRHGIHTDASHRFERGADFNATGLACRRVAEIITRQGGGVVAGPLLDVVARRVEIAPVELRLAQVQRILGKEIGEAEIGRILTRLGFGLRRLGAGHFEVTVPTWRLDISREIDLIEEIARVHGFNRFEDRLPALALSGGMSELPEFAQESKLRGRMLALGYNEALSNTFSSREDAARVTPGAKAVELENPLSEERAVMRTSLVPGMLDMLEHNLNRDQNTVRLFEMGNVFRAEGGGVVQAAAGCVGLSGVGGGGDGAGLWPEGAFFQLKGDVAALLAIYSKDVSYTSDTPQYLLPGRGAVAGLEGSVVAAFGEVNPAAYGGRKFKQPVYVGEIYLERLFALGERKPEYEQLSRYPRVERDFSFVVPDGMRWERTRSAVLKDAHPALRSFEIVEIFRGKAVPEGHYSALFRSAMQAADHTLSEEEIARASGRIVAALEGLGAVLRG